MGELGGGGGGGGGEDEEESEREEGEEGMRSFSKFVELVNESFRRGDLATFVALMEALGNFFFILYVNFCKCFNNHFVLFGLLNFFFFLYSFINFFFFFFRF